MNAGPQTPAMLAGVFEVMQARSLILIAATAFSTYLDQYVDALVIFAVVKPS